MDHSLKKRGGFTLVELLVVISIVSFLSSVVMASLNSARDKARIAKALQFDSQVHNSLGSEMLSEGSFEGTFNDSSGNGNTLSYTWGSPTFVSGIHGRGMSLDGNDGIEINDQPAKTKIGNGDSYVVSLWFKTSVKGPDQVLTRRFCSCPTFAWDVRGPRAGDGRIEFSLGSGSPTIVVQTYSKSDLADNKWHHVLAERDYQNDVIRLYVDGELNSESADITNGNTGNSFANMSIGVGDLGMFQGVIDEIRVYHSGL